MLSSERVLHNSHRFSLPWNRLCDPLRVQNEVRMAEVLGVKQEAPKLPYFVESATAVLKAERVHGNPNPKVTRFFAVLIGRGG